NVQARLSFCTYFLLYPLVITLQDWSVNHVRNLKCQPCMEAAQLQLSNLDIMMHELNGLDKKVKVCFLSAGEMYYGVYSDIFSSLPVDCFIRKPIENEELMRRIKEIVVDKTI
ncbi:MAG: hypothetical protein WBF33_22300, partial [Candidatus Nitrosopolaris sp.]